MSQVAHGTRSVRRSVQAFHDSVLAVYPKRGITECFRSIRIPTCKRGKDNLFAAQFKGVDSQLVGPGIGFESLDLVGAEDEFKQSVQTGTPDIGLQHFAGKI